MLKPRVTPVLRMFDVAMALEFYVGFLGFEEKWRHQFAPDLPVYMGVEREGVFLHLSQHFGDATPGTHIRIEVDDVDAFSAALNAKSYRNARPGVEEQPWGNRETTIHDPSGNRITFWTPTPAAVHRVESLAGAR
jgi:catechol 2,3-dioxygenase-like lactoylglutathione lyase family enzyme